MHLQEDHASSLGNKAGIRHGQGLNGDGGTKQQAATLGILLDHLAFGTRDAGSALSGLASLRKKVLERNEPSPSRAISK